jgi:hypothetical protein
MKKAKTTFGKQRDSGKVQKKTSEKLTDSDTVQKRIVRVSRKHIEQRYNDEAQHLEYEDPQDYVFCFDCNKTYFTNTQLSEHRQSKHKSQFAFSCTRSDYQCDNPNVVQVHDQTMHVLPAVKYQNQELKQLNEALMTEVNALHDKSGQ